nr:hypothetical protein [Tanacetum cinerariifolium]
MCMSYTDVAQVANAARNYEILHERDDQDTERPDKRIKGVKRPVVGITKARLYTPKCVAMGRTSSICQEEGW